MALPTMAAGRAIWEFFSERVELEPWDDDGTSVELVLEGSRGDPADVPLA